MAIIKTFKYKNKSFAYLINTAQIFEFPKIKTTKEIITRLNKLGVLKNQIRKQNILSKITAISINTSSYCNMRCRYCFASDGSYGQKPINISFKAFKEIINFYINYLKIKKIKKAKIIFFGGEPLINFEVIKKIVPYIEKRGKEEKIKFSFSMTSNGTLLNKTIMKFIKKHDIRFVMSLDGPQQVHDKMRKLKDGSGSFLKIINNLKTNDDFSPSIRATFTHACSDLIKIAKFFIKEKFSGVNIAPVESSFAKIKIEKQDLPSIKNGIRYLARKMYEYAIHNEKYPITIFAHPLEKINSGRAFSFACGAARDIIGTDRTGTIYPCHRFVGNKNFIIGNIKDGINHKLQRKFINLFRLENKELCAKCWIKRLCAGGCINNYIHKINSDNNNVLCEITRELYKNAIMLYIKLMADCPKLAKTSSIIL